MATIYESPDGGKTVYERPERSTHVTTLSQVDLRSKEDEEFWRRVSDLHANRLKDNKLWSDIRQMAKTNEGLHEILNQAIMLYTLLKEDPE